MSYQAQKFVGKGVSITPRKRRIRTLKPPHQMVQDKAHGRDTGPYRYGEEVVWDIVIKNHLVGSARLNPNRTYSFGIYNARTLPNLLNLLAVHYNLQDFTPLKEEMVRLET